MKVKTSITLERSTLAAVKKLARQTGANRSRIIEAAVIDFMERKRRAERDARELEILNRLADRLNPEIEDTLRYQADVWEMEP